MAKEYSCGQVHLSTDSKVSVRRKIRLDFANAPWAVSIPSNIAEGQARRTTGDYIRFVSIAEGSLAELETQLIIAIELNFCTKSETENCFGLMLEIRKMLNALRRSLLNKMNL